MLLNALFFWPDFARRITHDRETRERLIPAILPKFQS